MAESACVCNYAGSVHARRYGLDDDVTRRCECHGVGVNATEEGTLNRL